MLIKLDEHYSQYTNGFSEHKVEDGLLADCFTELCNRYPQLLVHLQDDDGEICHKSGFKLNGDFLVNEEAYKQELTASDILEFTKIIPTGESQVLSIIVAVVLIIVAVVIMVVAWWTGIAEVWGVNLIGFAVGLLVGSIAQLVMACFFYPEAPSMDTPSLADNSATYTFDGVKNTTASGTAVNIIYGKHRVGGQVLNIYTEVDETRNITQTIDGEETYLTNTYLYAQIAIGEGEVQGVDDIQVNQLPRDFYNEITTVENPDYVRYGTAQQPIMPNFNRVENTTTISRKVTKLSQDLTATPATYSQYTPVYGLMAARGYSLGSSDLKLGMYQIDVTYVDETAGG